MNAIVAKMRTLEIAAAPLLHAFASDENSPGKRLAAPDVNTLETLRLAQGELEARSTP